MKTHHFGILNWQELTKVFESFWRFELQDLWFQSFSRECYNMHEFVIKHAEVTYFFPSKMLWFVRPTFNDPKVLFTCDEQVSLCVDVAHVCIIKVACHCPQQFSGLQYCWFLVIWYQKNTISSHAHLSFRRRALRSLLGTETFASSSSVASMTCCNIRIAPSPIPTIGFTTALTNAWFIVV